MGQMADAALAVLDRGVEVFSLHDGLVAGTAKIELIIPQKRGVLGGVWRMTQAALAFLHGEVGHRAFGFLLMAVDAELLG